MVRDEFGIAGSVMTLPSQLSGRVFDMVKNVLPKNTLNLELAHLLIADSFSEDNRARDFFQLSDTYIEDYLPTIVETIQAARKKLNK